MQSSSEGSGVHLVHKPEGWTPLEALEAAGRQRGLGPRRSYAGRLDPMAEGLLVVLEGPACDLQHQWQNGVKEYRWSLLLGVASDSYDVLGMARGEEPRMWGRPRLQEAADEACRRLRQLPGTRLQPYPPYSSVRVRGHPLFWWAQQDRLDEIVVPQIEVTVHSCAVGCVRWIPAARVLQDIERRVARVSGTGFRQQAIVQEWQRRLAPLPPDYAFPVITAQCRVSSGTYIRSLAHVVGEQCSVGGLAWSIERISMGDSFSVADAYVVEPVSRLLFERAMRIVNDYYLSKSG